MVSIFSRSRDFEMLSDKFYTSNSSFKVIRDRNMMCFVFR